MGYGVAQICQNPSCVAGANLQVDGASAIAAAITAAAVGDLVLIAGKGNEDYQILGSTKIHFDDREEAERRCGRGWGEDLRDRQGH